MQQTPEAEAQVKPLLQQTPLVSALAQHTPLASELLASKLETRVVVQQLLMPLALGAHWKVGRQQAPAVRGAEHEVPTAWPLASDVVTILPAGWQAKVPLASAAQV